MAIVVVVVVSVSVFALLMLVLSAFVISVSRSSSRLQCRCRPVAPQTAVIHAVVIFFIVLVVLIVVSLSAAVAGALLVNPVLIAVALQPTAPRRGSRWIAVALENRRRLCVSGCRLALVILSEIRGRPGFLVVVSSRSSFAFNPRRQFAVALLMPPSTDQCLP